MFRRITKKLEPTPIGKLVVLMLLLLFLGAATVLVADTLQTRDSGAQTTWWYGFLGVVMFTFVIFVASVIPANSLAKEIRSWDRSHGNRASERGPGVSAIGEGSDEQARESASG